MMYLNRDDILKPRDLKVEEVDVPEWGGMVRILELTGEGQNAFQQELMLKHPSGQLLHDNNGDPILDLTNADAKLLVRTLVGDDDEPLLSLADIQALGDQSGVVIQRLATIARQISGLQKSAVEDAEGNSEAAPSGDSIST